MSGFRELVGLEVHDEGGGRARVELDVEERHLNLHGTVHGGVLATLADVAMGTAVASAVEGDGRPVTIGMTVTYLEPGQPGRLVVRATTRKPGKRITIVEAEATQGEDVVAHAIATFTTV